MSDLMRLIFFRKAKAMIYLDSCALSLSDQPQLFDLYGVFFSNFQV